MGQDLSIRQLCGPNQLLMVGPFGELAAGVINTTELRMCGAAFADAGPTTMLYPGVIVGMVVLKPKATGPASMAWMSASQVVVNWKARA